MTKMLIKQAADQLNTISKTVEELRIQMNQTSARLPEYPIIMAMKGVGTSLGPQLMAEIKDVTRFSHRGAITAFAGVNPGTNQSGSYEQQSVHISKRGSAQLRKTLFQIMDVLIKTSPVDDPVYAFMSKKREQCKPYYVYMTAGANKFLRIYEIIQTNKMIQILISFIYMKMKIIDFYIIYVNIYPTFSTN